MSGRGGASGGPYGTTAFHDLLDNQVVGSDDAPVGRVADVRAEWREDGRLVVTPLMFGPQALLGRVSPRLQPFAQWLLRGRFEHAIPIEEVREMGIAVVLRQPGGAYPVGREADGWIRRHVLRRISWFRY